ncbi:hypothetical protein [Streptosporangium brasiliense]|uniref:Uncharacterized protein n=2 Tax=Streptosporangium TaxID=2000 RepID=A0ABT9RMC1_9ACTN|nr:hypothetical protein [Streptosporangium brasiliense]MDP9870448.1 hypothetical protein [Streptosporangium brasiliense]
MKNGDISNEVSPRLLIEFEGLLGAKLTSRRMYLVARRLRRWEQAADLWDLDDLVIKVIIDLTWRLHQEIDVVTTGPREFARALGDRLDNEQVPVRRVWTYDPRYLARRLISMPYVTAVYTPDPKHALMYGSRGRVITPETITQIGRY